MDFRNNGRQSRHSLIQTPDNFYLYVYFLMEVQANIRGVIIDPQILYATIGVILFTIGTVTTEFFSEKKNTQ